MRVLHVGKYFPPFTGGIENYSFDLITALQATGVDCHALVHAHDNLPRSEPNVTRCPTWFEVAFTPISPSFPFKLRRLLIDWRPDLLHLHLPNPSAFWALTIARARRLPWVAHWHSDVVTSPHDRRLRYLYPFYRPVEQALLRRAMAIIATSPDYAHSSVPLRAHEQRIRTIPLGISESRLVADPAPTEWPGGDQLRVLSIGRLTYYKGFPVLLEALGKIHGAQLIIVGQGSQGPLLRDKIKQLGLSDRVELRDAVTDQQRNALMRDCDIFCLPSIERTEAFGLVLLEAMHAGKPVIATKLSGSGVPWVVNQGGNGLLCPPGDSGALAVAIERLRDHATRTALASRAIENFDANFSLASGAHSIKQLYRETLDGMGST